MLGDIFRKAKSAQAKYGDRDVFLFGRISVPERTVLRLTFESSESEWKQGVRIGDLSAKTALRLTIGEISAPGMKLWQYNSPPVVDVHVFSPERQICVYNQWDKGNGVAWSQIMGAGMLVEELVPSRKWRFRCNDGHSGLPTFSHLVFTLEIVD